MRFSGKVAIVTGGGGAIGRATCEILASEGAKVLIADADAQAEQVAVTMRSRGLQVAFVATDVAQEEQVARMVDTAVESWGRLDVVVANAGISGRGTAEQATLADWERVMGVNLTGVFLTMARAIPAMRAGGGGAIVSTASIMGLVGTRGAVPYAAAKGAVVNMTRSVALDCAKAGIRVNAVCPGFLSGPTSGDTRGEDKREEQLISLHPLGRLANPEDVAKAIAFLASDDAAFITGTSLVVDGGYTAQ